MRSLSSIPATRWFTYSLPLSAWKPRMTNGNCSSICSITGSRCASEIVCTVAVTSHCDAIDRVDVVQALGAVEVALMDAVDADEAGTSLGGWSLADADRHHL